MAACRRRGRRCPATGKLRYPDEIAAQLALISTKRAEQRRVTNERRYYRCPACGGFHLTSQTKEPRR